MTDPDKIIFIDTEFTNTTSEILELCVVNGNGEVLYHNHFKPVRAKYWKKFPHNISKTRVRHCRSFRRCLKDIRPLFDRAELVCGFAVDNDYRHLGEDGLRIDPAKMVELRQLYWVLKKDTGELADPFNLPGLSACAAELCPGLSLDAEHSAKGDTLTTYHLYAALKASLPQYGSSDDAEAWRTCLGEYREGVADYYRRRAHGYVTLRPMEGGYGLTQGTESCTDEGCISIEVADRFRAEAHFHDKFHRRLHLNQEPYKLRDSDIEYFKSYTDTFDPDDYRSYKKLFEPAEAPRPVKASPKSGKPRRRRKARKGGKAAKPEGTREKAGGETAS